LLVIPAFILQLPFKIVVAVSKGTSDTILLNYIFQEAKRLSTSRSQASPV